MMPVQRIFTKSEILTKNTKASTKVKICKDCKFYKDDVCQKFCYIDVVHGQQVVVPAKEARQDFAMCGIAGAHFVPLHTYTPINNYVEIKKED